MSRPGAQPDDAVSTRAQQAAAQRVRDAFAALLKDAKAGRIYQGTENADTQVARGRFRMAFLSGLREALQELPVIVVEVTPEGMLLGDHLIVESTERRGDLVESLFSEGLRALSIESGASDDELLTMGQLLLTPWHDDRHSEGLASAAWHADFAHVYFEVVDALAERETEELGESPIVRELQGLVAELNARADQQNEDDVSRMRQDELAVLLRLKDHVDFDGNTEGERLKLESTLSPALRDEVRACIADRDMARADVAGVLTTVLSVVAEPDRARAIGEALYSYVVNAVLADPGSSPLVQRTAELLDADLTPHLAHRETLRDAAAAIATEPTRSRLARLLAQTDPKAGTGLAFTLFLLLPGEDEAIELAAALPAWAVRVLADTVLLRAAPEPLVAIDVPRRFLAHSERGALLLGLAMAARQNDPRLIEPAIAHARHDGDDVREAVLVALRQHQTPKIRELVRGALADQAEGVRMEAMRNCVAYRDLEVLPLLEARLRSSEIATATDAELRGLCISYARIGGANTIPVLAEIADGRRPSAARSLPRLALHGLRAQGSEPARSAMQRVAHVVPALADEVRTLLGGAPSRSGG